MKFIRIVLYFAIFIGLNVSSADAAVKPIVSLSKTHAELTIGARRATVGNQQSPLKPRPTYICSVIRGVSYGAALVGIQSLSISLPSMATVAGAPVAAAGAGAFSAGISIATMIANDTLCATERITK